MFPLTIIWRFIASYAKLKEQAEMDWMEQIPTLAMKWSTVMQLMDQ
jgi:hypothetical protein